MQTLLNKLIQLNKVGLCNRKTIKTNKLKRPCIAPNYGIFMHGYWQL